MAQHSGSHHHLEAAEHYEQAARHHREASKHHDAGNHEKAGYHAYVAHAHHTLAAQHAEEAEKHYATAAVSARRWPRPEPPASYRADPSAAAYTNDQVSVAWPSAISACEYCCWAS